MKWSQTFLFFLVLLTPALLYSMNQIKNIKAELTAGITELNWIEKDLNALKDEEKVIDAEIKDMILKVDRDANRGLFVVGAFLTGACFTLVNSLDCPQEGGFSCLEPMEYMAAQLLLLSTGIVNGAAFSWWYKRNH